MPRKLSDDFRRAIIRSVIHHQNFPLRRRKILFQHAHNRLFYEAFVIVRVDQYADGRTSHHNHVSPRGLARRCVTHVPPNRKYCQLFD